MTASKWVVNRQWSCGCKGAEMRDQTTEQKDAAKKGVGRPDHCIRHGDVELLYVNARGQ